MRPGIRTLLVEDDQAITSSLELELERRNLSVRYAHDGKEALQQIEMFRPELIVLDIMLPKLDGIAATRARRLRLSAPRRKRLPRLGSRGSRNASSVWHNLA